MLNRTLRRTAGWLALGSLLLFSAPAGAATTLRLATFAPKSSAWGKMFAKWESALREKTHGEVELQVFYNGTQGDDESMVGKMRSGQLDGAALTSVGLSTIYKPVLVLQLPGIVDSWETLDRVRAGLKAPMERGFAAQGFRVVAWGDVGRVRQMSRGFAVRGPDALRGKSPVVWRNEPIGPVLYSVIGGVGAVPLGPAEVLPALRSGKVNVVSAPTLAAEQLQWTPFFDHIGSATAVCAIGGTVFRQSALDALPADLRAAFEELQNKHAKKSAERIRRLDEEAYLRLAKKMTVVELTEAERAEWEKVFRQTTERLGQGTFPPELVKEVVRLAGKK